MAIENYEEHEIFNPRYWIDKDLNIRDRNKDDAVVGKLNIVEVEDNG